RILAVSSWLQGAGWGFLFGIGHFYLGFIWLLTSLHDYGGLSRPLSYLVLFVLSAAMSVYLALFGAMLPYLARRSWWLMALAAPSLWVVLEWLRGTLFSGFPWNLIGYAWDPWFTILQIADLGGVYLLSWLTLFLAALLAGMRHAHTSGRSRTVSLAVGLCVLGMAHGYGLWRIHHLTAIQEKNLWVVPARIGLVQGNIAQNLKWDPAFQDKTVEIYQKLTRTLPGGLDLVIWPETAIPFLIQSSPEHLEQIDTLVMGQGASLLTGAPSAQRYENTSWHFFNSMFLLEGDGVLNRRYDKHHLVPFGEYIPFRDFIPATFTKFTEGTEDFYAGVGPALLPWTGGALGPLICYEAIFPEEVRQLARAGAKWLINITNDGWFGEEAKPQHMAMTRMRAVENRLPLIRVANTGISVVFDYLGQELARIPANVRQAIAVDVPRTSSDSLYRRTGLLWVWGCILLTIALSILAYFFPNLEKKE
ncbi:MAG: apolipoprotein N-acyltransferase, partial [Magnetococcus sp. DMHC-6]